MEWWVWVLIGLGLLGSEVLTPGAFYVCFFGIGALLVAALVGVGLGGPESVQWLLFSVLSIVSLLVFRRRLLGHFTVPSARRGDIDVLRDEVAVSSADLAPGAIGKAELRGTPWTVKNVGDQPLRVGQRCRVAGKEGLMLFVRAE
jgi:membrane protein implicated in regulation of membrane protease activity